MDAAKRCEALIICYYLPVRTCLFGPILQPVWSTIRNQNWLIDGYRAGDEHRASWLAIVVLSSMSADLSHVRDRSVVPKIQTENRGIGAARIGPSPFFFYPSRKIEPDGRFEFSFETQQGRTNPPLYTFTMQSDVDQWFTDCDRWRGISRGVPCGPRLVTCRQTRSGNRQSCCLRVQTRRPVRDGHHPWVRIRCGQ